MLVQRCPLCGGELQATEKNYHSAVVINERGQVQRIEEFGTEREFTVYCENDHELPEIVQAIKMEAIQ